MAHGQSLPTWANNLAKEGFTVQKGFYGFYDMSLCKGSDTCYAMNPITPYGLIYLPTSPEETRAGNYTNSCHLHNTCKEINGVEYSPAWRIAEGETIVVQGLTPPKSTYWSFTNYLYSRFHAKGWTAKSKDLITCPDAKTEGNRCEIFSGINDPLNDETFNNGTNAFNSSFSLVLSWDSKAEAAVAHQINLDSYPGSQTEFLRFPG